jgi:anti-sigma factor RsiW
MKGKPDQPTNDDLEAYIDSRLEPARMAEIESLLARDAKMAEMVRAMRFQNEALRCLGMDILSEPIPERLRAVVERRKAEEVTGKPRRVLVPTAPRRLA